MLDFERIDDQSKDAVLQHIQKHCGLDIQAVKEIASARVDFYANTVAYRIVSAAPQSTKQTRSASGTNVIYYVLVRSTSKSDPTPDLVLPLCGSINDIQRANRHLGLELTTANALQYAQFYSHFGTIFDPGAGPVRFDVPRKLDDVEVSGTASEGELKQEMSRLEGVMWRFTGIGENSRTIESRFELKRTPLGDRLEGRVPVHVKDGVFAADLVITRSTGRMRAANLDLLYRSPNIGHLSQEAIGTLKPSPALQAKEAARSLMRICAGGLLFTLKWIALPFVLLSALVSVAYPIMAHLGWIDMRRPLAIAAGFLGMSWSSLLLTTTIAALSVFVVYMVVMFDIDNVLHYTFKIYPKFREWRLGKWLLSQLNTTAQLNGSYDSFLGRVVAVGWRFALYSFFVVAAFVSLELAWHGDQQHVLPVERIARILLERAGESAPFLLYLVGWRKNPEGSDLLQPWLLPLASFVIGLIIIRGLHRFWSNTTANSFSALLLKTKEELRPGKRRRQRRKAKA